MTTAIATTTNASIKYVGTSAIRYVIAGITAAGAKLDAVIQDAGLSVLNHIELHGDVTLACELYNGMPKGSRKLALAEWMLAYGKVVANTDDKTKKNLPFVFAKDKSTNIEGAVAKAWFDFKPEKPVDQAFDFQAMLLALLNKADKAQAGGKEVTGADTLALVRKLVTA